MGEVPHRLREMKFLTRQERLQQIHQNPPAQKTNGVTSLWAHPLHLHSRMCSTLSSSKTFFFHILLQIQLLRGWERLLFCLWKINSHYKQDRKKEESEKKETDSYPCLSDPAWRLSSPLIALLISSPLSVDLGQQSSPAGADWRLFLHQLSHAAFFPPLTFKAHPCWNTTHTRIRAKYMDSCSEMTQDWVNSDFFFFLLFLVADYHFSTIFASGSWNRLARINLCTSLRWCRMCFFLFLCPLYLFPGLKCTWNASLLQELACKCGF